MLASVGPHCLHLWMIYFTGFIEPSVNVTQLPKIANILKGENISFDCSLSSLPEGPRVDIYWWKNGENNYINPDHDARELTGFSTKFSGFLQIVNVRPQDAGVYYCTIAHQGTIIGNGTGSTLVVLVPPTPLNIYSGDPEKSEALAILCNTSPFYPMDISLTWYKDGSKITTGSPVTTSTSDGLYEASGRLSVTQVVPTGTVYTCLVSHVTLRVSALATYIVINNSTGASIIRDVMTSICALSGLVSILLVFLIAKRCITRKNKGTQKEEETSDQFRSTSEAMVSYAALDFTKSRKVPGSVNQERTVYAQSTSEAMVPYAALDLTKSRKVPVFVNQERTVYAQTKQRPPDRNFTYARIAVAKTKKEEIVYHRETDTVDSQPRKNQSVEVIYSEQNPKD
ncbi:tapasin-related protein-like [Mobula hypostoma]|uniref:tapasin-related protein-like n=1 Tax=Mobula hypostoma TaxID=723540 RepID=UPI002FC33D49